MAADSDKTPSPTTEQVEPLTPEEIRSAFRRYDLIIAVGVALCAFFAASFRVSSPEWYGHLRAGQALSSSLPSMPTYEDFLYSSPVEGRAPGSTWLFDLVAYRLSLLGDIVPVVLKIAIVVLTTLIILSISYPGPTLAWRSVCALIAVVGFGSRIDLGTTVLDHLFIASALWLWHRGELTGKGTWFLLVVPLVVVWTNTTTFFLSSLFLLVPWLFGYFLRPVWHQALPGLKGGPTLPKGALVACLMGIASLAASPFFVGPIGVFARRLTETWRILMTPDLLDAGLLDVATDPMIPMLIAHQQRAWTPSEIGWAIAVALWIVTTLMNIKRLNFGRVLMGVAGASMPFLAVGLTGSSAIILSVLSSLAGQEWFLSRWKGQVSTSFSGLLLAQLSRVAIILAVFAGLIGSLTGRVQGRLAQFGFAIDHEAYMERGARWLHESGLKGHAIHLGPLHRLEAVEQYANPKRRSFWDPRWPWINTSRYAELIDSLLSGPVDEEAEWEKGFAEHSISHILVDIRDESTFMRRARSVLASNPKLVPLHADDQVIVYGYLGSTSVDFEIVKEKQLRTNVLAFREKREPPAPTERFVSAPGWADMLWPLRTARRPTGLDVGTFFSSGGSHLSDPGSSILAAYHLRNAVSESPDSPDAHLRLGIAYLGMCTRESDLVRSGSVSEDAKALLPIQTSLTRHHQAISSLNAARIAGSDNAGVYVALSACYQINSFKDLALEALEQQLRFASGEEERNGIERTIQRLRGEVKSLREAYEAEIKRQTEGIVQLAEEDEKRSTELEQKGATLADEREKGRALGESNFLKKRAASYRNAASADRHANNAQIALALGLAGVAENEMDQVPASSSDGRASASFATRLYLQVGEVEKAMQRVRAVENDPNASPGLYHWLLAQISLTQGQFQQAADSLTTAIEISAMERAMSALGGAEYRLRTGTLASSESAPLLVEISQLANLKNNEASMHFDRALVYVELAQPTKALEDFHRVMALSPESNQWPIINYYVRAMTGDPLPPRILPSPEDEIARRLGLVDEPQGAITPDVPVLPTPAP